MSTKFICILLTLLLVLSGCGSQPAAEPAQTTAPAELTQENLDNAYLDAVTPQILDPQLEAILVTEPPEPPLPDILEPEASGTLVMENEKAIIDYSNTADGYIMVCFTAETQQKLKLQVKGPTATYTYTLRQGQWAAFPLSDGNGSYQFKVHENISGSQYSLVAAAQQDVVLTDEFAPFLRPNQYVNYSASSQAVELAWELTQELQHPLEKVEAIYDFVVRELVYDNEKAATVKSGYVPDLDAVLESRKGICFDYASLMTGMLRSQGIPCKMVFGYTGGVYHAWISVWTEDTGWVDGVIFFDGTSWQRLDPTFASSANQSEEIMAFIGNGSNYREKYFY